jgi:predicted membrane protein
MPDRFERHRRGSLMFGLAAIAVGVIFTFYQSDIFPTGIRLDFFGVVFMVLGVSQVVSTSNEANRFWGVGLFAVGLIMQTNTMGVTHLHIRNLWPVAIILVGISTLWHTLKEDPKRKYKLGVFRRMQGDTPDGDMPENPEINMDFVMGGGEPRVESKNFRGGRVNAMLGGFVLDLTRAEIEGDEAVLYVNTILGGGEIKVPETWLVEMHGSAILGGYDNKTRYFQPDASKPLKKLIIRGNAILGGIEVKNP